MTTLPWFSFYIADYSADTIGLTLAQHGAYLLSMLKYYRKGEALTDEEMRESTQEEYKRIIRFYIWEGDLWHHKRIDKEIREGEEKNQKMKERSKLGNQARWGPPKRKINGSASHEKSTRPQEL